MLLYLCQLSEKPPLEYYFCAMDTMVMFTVSELKIMTAQHLLTQAGIRSFVLNKKDSAHAGVFGDIELHVLKIDKDEAYKILFENGIID